MIMSGI